VSSSPVDLFHPFFDERLRSGIVEIPEVDGDAHAVEAMLTAKRSFAGMSGARLHDVREL